MVIKTCPQCGADLSFYVLTSIPPINVAYCIKCGWKYSERESIIREPFQKKCIQVEVSEVL